MRNGLFIALLAGLTVVPDAALAQLEIGGFVAAGQRWHDGGRTFTGGALSIGARTPDTRPGIGFGVRLGVTMLPSADPNPNCALTCSDVPVSYTISMTHASVFLIPVRVGTAEFEVGFGTSETSGGFETDVSALLLNVGFSVPMGNDTRLHVAFDRQVRPNQADMLDYRERQMFRHLARLGLVYAPKKSVSR